MFFGLFQKKVEPEVKKYKHKLPSRQTVFLLVKERLSHHYSLFLTQEKYQEWIDKIENKTAKFIQKNVNGDVYAFKTNDSFVFVLYRERLVVDIIQYSTELVRIAKGFK